eukprot:TRINITY_DN17377_c0_g1_i1.p1 TRINITY_DN17377_c0_g1~~TRINITY_DN17377_c0_g1_i1.p1  ORF type:complete len:336 (-),score=45.48 TRINITY_DN17377_c0_g1_i1:18-1025(-)
MSTPEESVVNTLRREISSETTSKILWWGDQISQIVSLSKVARVGHEDINRLAMCASKIISEYRVWIILDQFNTPQCTNCESCNNTPKADVPCSREDFNTNTNTQANLINNNEVNIKTMNEGQTRLSVTIPPNNMGDPQPIPVHNQSIGGTLNCQPSFGSLEAKSELNFILDTSTLLNEPHKSCEWCGTSSTPEWRRGPNGPKTLCNACGLKCSKRAKQDSPTNKSKSPLPGYSVLGPFEISSPTNGIGPRTSLQLEDHLSSFYVPPSCSVVSPPIEYGNDRKRRRADSGSLQSAFSDVSQPSSLTSPTNEDYQSLIDQFDVSQFEQMLQEFSVTF